MALEVGSADFVSELEDRMREAEVQVAVQISNLGGWWCPPWRRKH